MPWAEKMGGAPFAPASKSSNDFICNDLFLLSTLSAVSGGAFRFALRSENPDGAMKHSGESQGLISNSPIAWLRLRAIVDRLRDPLNGCAWDRAQSCATIAPYTIEEAYEVADAIARSEPEAICDELGDLLFQVVLHAKIAEQNGWFALDDVVNAIADKMERRHPHIFAAAVDGAEAGAGKADWEQLKSAERGTSASQMAGIARALPALMRAEKIQKRAARTGFDWPDADGPLAKIHEELAEVAAAPDQKARTEEVGDLLFAVVNYARHLNVDAEQALAAANDKFISRFEAMATHIDKDLNAATLEEMDRAWEAIKDHKRTGV